ncbi:MAG: hydroxymethylglutaryl-CoA lyase [Flavobacteriales bacterium]|tara:strand:- start:10865 stop:11713 length:849 start_codon:yes stop_codon:yes gene_type:complete
MIQLIECPRDAMQGFENFIPTNLKAEYINTLLKVGFHTIDFGSFVSPKAIPQMRDTAEVLSKLNLEASSSKLLAIVANSRGAEQAASFSEIQYLGYPFSVSEVFQKRNTNRTIEDSLILVDRMQNLVAKQNKELVVYLSMAFGNPYQEVWHPDIVAKYTEILVNMGIRTLALSDTIGVSTKETISPLFSQLIPEFNEVTFGAHLHTNLKDWKEKVLAAYLSGCFRFDTAIKGLGGCPMAKDELTGNMPTEKMLSFLNEQDEVSSINPLAFESAYNKAIEVFR